MYPVSLLSFLLVGLSHLATGCAPSPCPEGFRSGDDGLCYEEGADTGMRTRDTGSEPAPSCVEDDAWFETLEASLTEIPTVAEVRWETPEAVDSEVRFEVDGETREVEAEPDETDHQVILLGLPPSSTVTWQVFASGTCSTPRSLETGSLPSDLPTLTLSEVDEDALSGWITTVLLDAWGGYAVILDDQGRFTWWYPAATTTTQAVLSRDGTAVLFNEKAQAEDEPGRIWRVDLDGRQIESILMDGIHTDFEELPDGGYAALGWDVRTFEHEGETRKILGNTIEEMNADGEVHTVWNVFDDFEPNLDEQYDANCFYPADCDVEDWSHVNSLSYDADEDVYYVTIGHLGGIGRIDRATGELAWVLSSTSKDFDIGNDQSLLSSPHSASPLEDDRLLVFNRYLDAGGCSEATEIAVDPDAGEAERTWSYTDPECLNVSTLGDAQRLANGNTLVVWSSAGQVDQVNPEGESVWQVSLDVGSAFGFGSFTETLYP